MVLDVTGVLVSRSSVVTEFCDVFFVLLWEFVESENIVVKPHRKR